MSEQVQTKIGRFNPLSGAEFNAKTDADLKMMISADCVKFSLRIPLGDLKKAADAFGQDIPEKLGEMSAGPQKSALCLGPDEWLLLAPQKDAANIVARFAQMYELTAHSMVDVSDRTIGIELYGPLARLVLNSGCPLDLEKIPAGHCTRSVLDKAQIILMKLEEQHYRLEIVRSFAPYVWNFLKNAASQLD